MEELKQAVSSVARTFGQTKIVRRISDEKQSSWEMLEAYDDDIDIFQAAKDDYRAVLKLNANSYSIVQQTTQEKLLTDMDILIPKLKPFTQVDSIDADMLNKVCSCIVANPRWSPAHVAVICNFEEAFSVKEMVDYVNSQDCENSMTPLHLAVKERNLSMVRLLLENDASVYIPDENNETVLHTVVETFKADGDSELLSVLSKALRDYVLMQDLEEAFTPLIQAVKSKKFDAARIMVANKVLLDIPDEDGYPIHHALKKDNLLLAAEILANDGNYGFVRCKKNDATPLHWARSPEMIKVIFGFDYELNVRSRTGHTAVHIMVQKGRIDCLVELLAAGADPDIHDNNGNRPLHTAARLNDVNAIRALIVFNADVDGINSDGITPRHFAAAHGTNGGEALQALHMVGAMRCQTQTSSCLQGCLPWGKYDGDKMVYPHDPMEESDIVFKKPMDDIVDQLLATCREWRRKRSSDPFGEDEERYDKVLCLDGGGSRGSVQIQLLAAIERACDKRIIDCFDWIVGTSAGAINTGILSTGACITEMRKIFFGTTAELFAGSKPYTEDRIERLLKQVFGEKKLMHVEKPKIMITGALSNRAPPALHLFRNYKPPATSSSRIAAYNGTYDKPPAPPNDELLWRAIRASTAAPTFFPPKGLFMDGGLVSNNPAMDAMTEISEYYTEKRLQGEPVRKIGLVVSLGTGNGPVSPMHNIHVYIPQAVTDIFKVGSHIEAAQHMGEIMLSLVTDARFRPVDRVRAWCSDIGAAYFRLCPNLSIMTDIDETDTNVILRLLWESQVYVHNNRDKIDQIGELLSVM